MNARQRLEVKPKSETRDAASENLGKRNGWPTYRHVAVALVQALLYIGDAILYHAETNRGQSGVPEQGNASG